MSMLWFLDALVTKDWYGTTFGNRCPVPTPRHVLIYFGTLEKAQGEGEHCSGGNLLQQGWGSREENGVWSNHTWASIVVSTMGWGAEDVVATFSFNTYTGLGFYNATQTVTAFVDDWKVGEWEFATGAPTPDTRIVVAGKARANLDHMVIRLHVSPMMNPKALHVAEDSRDLGLNLATVVFN